MFWIRFETQMRRRVDASARRVEAATPGTRSGETTRARVWFDGDSSTVYRPETCD